MAFPEPDITLGRILRVVRRRALLVVLCTVVAAGGAFVYLRHEHKQYTATAALLFNGTSLSQQVAGLQVAADVNAQSQQDTDAQLLQLGDLAQKTAARVGGGLTARKVTRSITITPSGDTTLVNVSSTLGSPTLAARVATTYANQFVTEQENGDRQYYASALATVERQLAKLSPGQAAGADGLSLQNRAQSLATLVQLHDNTVSLAQAAKVPLGPSAPSVGRNAILAGLLGLLLGLALAFVAERLDQSIREPQELERIYGLPLLGAVPNSSALRRGRAARSGTQFLTVADTFQFVRARLRYFNVDRDLRTLAVVSAQPGDGKTTIAHWLANAAAASGSRALLIEADLRRPTLAEEVGVGSGPGLADVLIEAESFERVTQAVKFFGAGAGHESEHNLDVIVAGGLPPNPGEMLESRAMSEVLRHAAANYEFVVIDTPPLGLVADALPLLAMVDGVLIVAGVGRTRRDVAKQLRETLASVDAPVLGVVANRVRSRGSTPYGYGYAQSRDGGDPRPGDGANSATGHVQRDNAVRAAVQLSPLDDG